MWHCDLSCFIRESGSSRSVKMVTDLIPPSLSPCVIAQMVDLCGCRILRGLGCSQPLLWWKNKRDKDCWPDLYFSNSRAQRCEDVGDPRHGVSQHGLYELLNSYAVSYYRIVILYLGFRACTCFLFDQSSRASSNLQCKETSDVGYRLQTYQQWSSDCPYHKWDLMQGRQCKG